jgi:eukaryotic-like serine/threonine-protein kinase
MLGFPCPSCQKKLQVGDEHAGKKIKCPGCGHVSTAVAPLPPAAEIPPPMAVMLSARPVDETVTKAPSETQPSHDATLFKFLAPPQADGELGRLGKYRILSVLGHGGMGVVYKAEDSVLNRVVALKAILPSLGVSASARKRFLREARTMGQLEHDHIVRLYEVGEDRGIPFLAMEFLVGEPLDQRLKSEPVLPLAEALRIGREIAEGLAAAHARDVIHRDIKPANVFLAEKAGRVKILDFGLARAVEEEARITQSGAILGSPGYMAPEQTRGEKADFRADLFSLGVVLYQMSTGAQPFAAPDALSTMMAVAMKNPIAPQMQNLDVPGELSELIMQLLEKDPAKRTGSALAAVEALQQIERQQRGEIVPAPQAGQSGTRLGHPPLASPVKVAPAVRPKDKEGLPWLLIGAAIAAVCLCFALTLVIAAITLFL